MGGIVPVGKELLTLETTRERGFVKYVEADGFQAIKITKRSWPDRVIILSSGYSFMIEFKRDADSFGKRTGEKFQRYRHNKLRDQGMHVYLCDTLKEAKAIYAYELAMNISHCRTFEPYQP